MNWNVRAAAAAFVLLLPGAAWAEAPLADATADLRCLILSFQMIQNEDPKIAQAAMISGFYYLGRIDGADPNLDLEAKLVDGESQFKGRDIGAEILRCSKALGDRGQELQDMGARVAEIERSRKATKGQKGI